MTAFDTLSAAKALEAAGVAPDQAEEHARLLREATAGLATKADLHAAQDALNSGRADLATKADLLAVKADLQAVKTDLQTEIQVVKTGLQSEIQAVETRLKADMAALEIRMMDRMARWFVWHFAGTVGLAGLALAAV